MSDIRNLDTIGFKYKIGDRLMHVGHTAMSFSGEPGRCAPACFVVGERVAQECPGGVQLKYGGTWASADGHVEANKWLLLESDLIPYEVNIGMAVTQADLQSALTKIIAESMNAAKE